MARILHCISRRGGKSENTAFFMDVERFIASSNGRHPALSFPWRRFVDKDQPYPQSLRTSVLVNATAGPASSNQPLVDALRNEPDFELRELTPENWDAVLSEVVGECGRIVIAGGDGTIHAVVNAVLNAGKQPTLGLVPLGTGNDFCRTLAIPTDPSDALRALRTADVRSLDAVRVSGDRSCFFANAVTAGFSGQVAAEVTSDLKSWWGPFAYLRGAAGTLADLPRFQVTLRFDDGPPEQVELLNIVVANARTAAGGIVVAPNADPEDGLLDVVLVRSGDALDLPLLAARLLHGNYVDDANVTLRRAKRLAVESEQTLPLSIDGELCEGRRFTFEVVPHALRIAVGPDYARVPAPIPAVEDDSESAREPDSPRERFFGLTTGLLLVAKRIRSGTGVWILGTTLVLILSAFLAQGVVAEEWRDWNQSIHAASRAGATPALDRFALAITWLGGGWGSALVVSAFLILFVRTKHYLTAGTLLIAIFGVLLIEAVLKPLFALARPVMADDALLNQTGYAFPSGHALRGVGIYGLLAALAVGRAAGRPLAWIAAAVCIAVAIGICWSRVYLGVHWPTDVIMGGLLAAAWVSICLLARHRIKRTSGNPGAAAR